jgi:hypothetical protein
LETLASVQSKPVPRILLGIPFLVPHSRKVT